MTLEAARAILPNPSESEVARLASLRAVADGNALYALSGMPNNWKALRKDLYPKPMPCSSGSSTSITAVCLVMALAASVAAARFGRTGGGVLGRCLPRTFDIFSAMSMPSHVHWHLGHLVLHVLHLPRLQRQPAMTERLAARPHRTAKQPRSEQMHSFVHTALSTSRYC